MRDEQAARRLAEKIIFAGTIEALTGMHIGGNDVGLGIGGADKLVVRDAATKRPYIPGSSLKGKMRSLLEKTDCARNGCRGFAVAPGKLELKPCDCGSCAVCVVFGVPADKKRPLAPDRPYAGASRILVRDAFLSNHEDVARWPNLDLPYAEIKTEVAIDRLTSAANPRQFERVPAGSKFQFEIVLNAFDGDDAEEHVALVERGLALAADDAIGGQGSRGYGQVCIELSHLARVPVEEYADDVRCKAAREKNTLATPKIFGGRLRGEASAA